MNTATAILKTTALVYGLIFTFAILLTLVFRKANWGRNMLAAILSWAAIFVVFLATSYAGNFLFTCLIALIAFLAVNEYYHLRGVNSSLLIWTAGLMLAGTGAALYFGRKDIFYAIPGLSVMVFFATHIMFRSYDGINERVGTAVTGFIYWGWLPFYFVLLHRLDHGFGYIVILCTMIAFNDNSAYYTGKLLGKRSPKFSPRISPNKTWVGTIGGFIATILIALAFQYAVPHFSTPMVVLLAIVVALSIPIGDLIESAIKRDLKVKDAGKLIPGHGGAMDRFDSWVFTVPIMYYFLLFIT